MPPLAFISHKHDDTEIAEVVGRFVRDVTGGHVEVFLSSHPDFKGPRLGKELGHEMKIALGRASLAILVYTSQDQDWSYCMWECGLAEDPRTADTKVVVLQCLKDKPKVFEGRLHAQAWEEKSLVGLAKRFREEDFFPDAGKAMTSFSEAELENKAKQFHVDLVAAIPPTAPENWAAWPYVRLELPRKAVDAIKGAKPEERQGAALKALRKHGTVADSASGSPALFGKVEFEPELSVAKLVDGWQKKQPARTLGWLDEIAKQVAHGVDKDTPTAERRERFRPVKGDEEYVSCVGRVKSKATSMQFDCYFIGVAEVPQVRSIMTSRDAMYAIDLKDREPSSIKLSELLENLNEQGWNRVPVLEGDQVRYIVHISMVDRFIRTSSFAGQPVADMTLADVLADADMETLFSSSFTAVGEHATVAEAQSVMAGHCSCQDIIVTASGEVADSVLGWLTDHDITTALG